MSPVGDVPGIIVRVGMSNDVQFQRYFPLSEAWDTVGIDRSVSIRIGSLSPQIIHHGASLDNPVESLGRPAECRGVPRGHAFTMLNGSGWRR